MRWFLGIDISKSSFDTTLLDGKSGKLHHDRFTMDKEGLDALMKHLTPLPKDSLFIVMESTGIYHLPLLAFLLEQGFTCSVINPTLLKHHIQSSTLRKSKTDRKDALAIARFASMHHASLKPANLDALRSIRPLLREREALSKEVAKLKTDIKALVDQLFPELSKNTNIFTRSILHLLLQAPSRKRVRNLKEKKIQRILDKASGNKVRLSAKEILALAKNSIGINNPHLETVLQSKIRRLEHVQSEIETLEKAIEEAVKEERLDDDIHTLTSIPGIGTTTATNFVAEIGSIKRFASVKQLCAFIGFDPAIRQSGSSIDSKGHISKRGHASLRRTLWQMAIGVIRCLPKYKAYYEKKRQEGKTFKQAVVAVGNKLLRLLFTLLKNKMPFHEELAMKGVTA